MNRKKLTFLFFLTIAMYALAAGFSDSLLSNYFSEVYNADAELRGIIEFPRELPGIISLFLISSIAFMGNYRIGMLSQGLFVVSIVFLGLYTPSFPVMILILFMFSMGAHLFIPIQDAIAFSIFDKEENFGAKVGQYKACGTIFSLIAATFVFFGFRYNIFTFENNIISVFLIAGFFATVAFIALFIMNKEDKSKVQKREKFKLLFRKEYKYYYAMAILYGTQKQIVLVFGPWVFIELLGQGADTIALLTIISSLASTFFLRALGKWIDKFGIRKIMYADAFSFIGVYIVYGILTAMIVDNKFSSLTVALVCTGALFVADRISNNIGIVRNIYLNSIAVEKSDITKAISTGMGLDHLVTILFAPISGYIWTNVGPQYIFFFAAFLSIFNIIIAKKANIK